MNNRGKKSSVKSLHELGVEFGMVRATKREIALEVVRRARRKGVTTVEIMRRKKDE